jgi:sigma-E factor negative regulatory protein RseB
VASGAPAFRASELPPGFHLTVAGAQTLGGATLPASHLVYSDGLATVSVFVEAEQAASAGPSADSSHDTLAPPPLHGLSRLGSGYAFSTVVQGHQVTAVGEVPAETVEFIAHSVKSYSSGDVTRH